MYWRILRRSVSFTMYARSVGQAFDMVPEKMVRCGVALVTTAALVAQGCARNPRPRQPPSRVVAVGSFTVTAYCMGTRTAAGTRVTSGVVAADSSVLPIGTVIELSGLTERYNRTYKVMDTGAQIRGRRLDLYVADCAEARRFGR